MLSKTINDAFNAQIACELESAYVYLAMAAHLEARALPGCAHWMRAQSQEEVAHAMRLFEHVLDRDGSVELRAIPAPPSDFGSVRDTFATALEHERKVTKSIHDIYSLATDERDFATQTHLQWFIDEQVEEEKTASDVLDLFTRAGDDEPSLLLIDQKLAARAAPTSLTSSEGGD